MVNPGRSRNTKGWASLALWGSESLGPGCLDIVFEYTARAPLLYKRVHADSDSYSSSHVPCLHVLCARCSYIVVSILERTLDACS